MHNPACETWEQHVDLAYQALHDQDSYDLLLFTDFLVRTFDDERLIADPESIPWFESRREESAA